MRILITNNALDQRAGTELYVRDLAVALLNRGHTPIAYSSQLGEVARDIRAATIPVIDNLDALGVAPDIIHGHHHVETMSALLRFPGVPAVYFCHGWLPWEETPPRFPRILRYVAVDHACRDRLILESGVPAERVSVLLNFVDLERFKPRNTLPARPGRALVFSNYASEQTHSGAVRAACARHGIAVDIVGSDAGNACAHPEEILGQYDLVFAKGKAALEALAVGAAVVLCDAKGVGPLVTASQFDQLRLLNFGLRALRDPVNVDVLDQRIASYDAEDAANVSRLVRASAGRDAIVEQIISLYRTVMVEHESLATGQDQEARAAAEYVAGLASMLKDAEYRALVAESDRVQLLGEGDRLRALLAGGRRGRKLWTQSKDKQVRLTQQLADRKKTVDKLALKSESTPGQLEEILIKLAEKEAELERINNSLGGRLLRRFGPIKYETLLPAYRSIRRIFGSETHNRTDQRNGGSTAQPDSQLSRIDPPHLKATVRTPIMKEVFTDIYRRRAWGEECESVSGPGSSVARTTGFRDDIAVLFKELNVRTVLDAGCGDFNWMKLVNLDLDRYIGVDVVSDLISENQRQYGNAAKTFLNLDISKEKLPKVDLILSRDCLVHFSSENVLGAIKNFKESGSTYLLTTTFTSVDKNTDIENGHWRQLNLQVPPFNFPGPLKLIDEIGELSAVINVDKYLGLWALKDIRLD